MSESAAAVAFARPNLREQIKDVILQRIVEGSYEPGSRIVETRIAQELGVSQAPVREALRDLEQLGCVVHEPVPRLLGARVLGRGAARGVPGARRARGAGRAAGRRADQRRTSSPSSTELLERMREAATRGDAHDQSQANASFHATIVRAARNADARAPVERCWSRSRGPT